jgi:hypothetical protein
MYVQSVYKTVYPESVEFEYIIFAAQQHILVPNM